MFVHIKFDYTGTSDEKGENGEFKSVTFQGVVPDLPTSNEDFKALNTLNESSIYE